MTKNFFLSLFTVFGLLHISTAAHAMSRHHDGEARIWVKGNDLCLGVDDQYATDGIIFFNRAQVDENQVKLYRIAVSGTDSTLWDYYLPPESMSNGPLLTSSTCLVYGQTISSFITRSPAKPVEAGLYKVMLEAIDHKDRRAWFYTRVCVSNQQGTWTVTPVKVNKNETNPNRFYCE
ncbi:hypothetical protein [Pseudomonas sp. 5P_3.1_Bac2]|uniref:hypothetical protein n=1 Tax=Pseudomonas sp. 5P_3.1_Bac2 TaxID=2971617 RepID=UPI0021C607F8|nr:hypothetical protein [Pseudomonas sp. 5P_3.1_Bac2]MCU1717818.1 hypothetical protein [Pseudomonas sp. 5P_3.1_Bac2]